jgi:hypothetical protein
MKKIVVIEFQFSNENDVYNIYDIYDNPYNINIKIPVRNVPSWELELSASDCSQDLIQKTKTCNFVHDCNTQ